MSSVPIIFDRNLLRIKRDRASINFKQYNFIHKYSADNIVGRINLENKYYQSILDLSFGGGEIMDLLKLDSDIIHTDISERMLDHAEKKRIVCDAENIPFLPNSFDLIISNLALHNINDLPGSLIQIKNCLKPNGIFLASIFGGSSLHELRTAMLNTEIEMNIGSSPHIFPFIEIKDMAMLMQRAGFSMPVADAETITVEYPNVYKLMHDLRFMGEGNILVARSKKYLGKKFFENLNINYKSPIATFEIITVTGIKP